MLAAVICLPCSESVVHSGRYDDDVLSVLLKHVGFMQQFFEYADRNETKHAAKM